MNFQVQQFFARFDQILSQVLSNPYLTATVSLFVILYAGLAAPQLPPMIAGLFDFTLVKMLVLTLILLVNNYNPPVAILVAVAFFISLQTLSRYHIYQMAGEVISLGGLIGDQEDESTHQMATPTGDVAASGLMGMSAPASKYGYGPEAVMDYNEGPGIMETQVSGLTGRTDDFMGPQGMGVPMGYEGTVTGADLQ